MISIFDCWVSRAKTKLKCAILSLLILLRFIRYHFLYSWFFRNKRFRNQRLSAFKLASMVLPFRNHWFRNHPFIRKVSEPDQEFVKNADSTSFDCTCQSCDSCLRAKFVKFVVGSRVRSPAIPCIKASYRKMFLLNRWIYMLIYI